MNEYLEVGTRLKEFRENENISLEYLAKTLGVSSLVIKEIEQGKALPRGVLLSELRIKLNLDIIWLLYGKGNMYVDAQPDEMKMIETNMELYSRLPNYLRQKVDKYMNVISRTKGMNTQEIKIFIEYWNQEHPNMKTAYSSLKLAIKKFKNYGLAGLVPKYGKNKGKKICQDDV